MQIFFTEDFTFIRSKNQKNVLDPNLYAPSDSGSSPIRVEMNLHTITNENFNSVQSHFSGEVGQNDRIAMRKLHTKKGVRERLIYDAFYNL
jgi:hypothetical protein